MMEMLIMSSGSHTMRMPFLVNRSIYGLLLSSAFTIDTVWQVTGCNIFLFYRFAAKMKFGGFIVTTLRALLERI